MLIVSGRDRNTVKSEQTSSDMIPWLLLCCYAAIKRPAVEILTIVWEYEQALVIPRERPVPLARIKPLDSLDCTP